MASETITTYFTESTVDPAAPDTGLTPTISIWQVSDNSVLVNEESMVEVGGGWYKYVYEAYTPSVRITFRCDSGITTGDFRYTWGSNSDDVQLVAKLPGNYIMGSSVTADKDTVIDDTYTLLGTVNDALGAAGSILTRIAGLVHENTYITHTYDDEGNNTGSTIQVYDSKANADIHNGTTGLVATYTLVATYEDNLPTSHKMVKDA